MFEFIKSLFRKTPTKPAESKCPFLSHVDINESIVITEVELAEVKPKTSKPRATKLKEVKPATKPVAKGVKPAKPKTPKTESAKIVQLVQPIPPKKKGRPKKDKIA